MRSSSIILISGGLDSLAAFHWAHQNTDIIMGITMKYGQRAAEREVLAAGNICRSCDIQHRVIELPWFATIKTSALMDETIPLPELKQKDLKDLMITTQSAKAVWVPNRNGVFLNVAASIAEHVLANWIVVGFNKEEAQTFPDNSESFVDVANFFFKYSTKDVVKVKAPMNSKTKKEIVQWLLEHNIDLSHLWSCYRGEERMCGACESCLRLMRALEEANASDWIKRLF